MSVGIKMFMNGKLDTSFLALVGDQSLKVVPECDVCGTAIEL